MPAASGVWRRSRRCSNTTVLLWMMDKTWTLRSVAFRWLEVCAQVGAQVCGIPVVGTVADLPELRRDYARLVVVIGNNEFRAQLYRRAAALGYEFPNLIAPSAYISPYASLGWGCVVLNNALVQNGAAVGNGVLINPGVEIFFFYDK